MQTLNTKPGTLFPSPPQSPIEAVLDVLGNLFQGGEKHGGLWPSCLDLQSREMPDGEPGVLDGQRQWDRALFGCNLMHDIPALGLAYSLSEKTGRADFHAAADRYFQAFVSQCAETATGLFPWGEHAYWNLRRSRPGNSITDAVILNGRAVEEAPGELFHDHLRQAPFWFWRKVGEFSPSSVQRFADGLDRHWVTDDRDEYNRHAVIDSMIRLGRPGRSCDFPRHSGFYILDLVCAYRQQARPETLVQIRRFADYWWERRVEGKPLYIESRSPLDSNFHQRYCPSQTISLGVSLLDAADLLRDGEPELSEELRQRGTVYCGAFLQAPHGEDTKVFAAGFHEDARQACGHLPVFGSVYGTYPVAQAGLICCAAFRHLGDERLLMRAKLGARALHANRSMLRTVGVPALDAGLALELLSDLYDITRNREWLRMGREIWPVVSDRFFTNGLVRLAAGGGWYEAQQGTGYLLHGVMRWGLFDEDPASPSIPPDYSAR